MFLLTVCLTILVIAAFIIRVDVAGPPNNFASGATGPITGFMVIPVLLVLVLNPMVNYADQIRDSIKLQSYDERIEIAVARADDLSAVLRTELEKYPDIEREIMTNLDPSIILSFPNLKSNQTISLLATELADLRDKQFKLADERVDTLEVMANRNASPWVLRGWWWNDYSEHVDELTRLR